MTSALRIPLKSVGALLLVLAVATVAWSLAAPPAVAATPEPIQIDATDPAGDASYGGVKPEDGVDLLAFSILQDRVAKTVSGTVDLAGQVARPGDHELRIGLGRVTSGGCDVSNSYGWVHIRHDMGTDFGDYVVGTATDVRENVTVVREGNRIAFATPAAPGVFDKAGFRCIVVTTERLLGGGLTDGNRPYDRMIGYAAELSAAPVGEPVVDTAGGKGGAIVDADGDGIRDALDRCPMQPGAGTDGCELVPLADSIKLGTKRVVVNRLMETLGGTCPAAVKVVVKLKGKTYGKQKVGTLTKGRYCHVIGVVSLKKRINKARVTITGSSVVSVGATVKKVASPKKKTKKKRR